MKVENQKGVVIIVALIVLLVMTGVGVTLMTGATLQERMAGNNKQYALALANAEAALRRAEEELNEAIVTSEAISTLKAALYNFYVNDSGNSRYSDFPIPGDPTNLPADPLNTDLSINTSWTTSNSVAASVTTTSSTLPRYVIEYLGQSVPPTTTRSIDISAEKKNTNDDSLYFFQITAIGYGADDDIYAVLQSTYSTASN